MSVVSRTLTIGRARIRRVKCDEVKPCCDKCTRTGRKCDGYQTEPVVRRKKTSEVSEQRVQKILLPKLSQPSSELKFENDAEFSYFRIFQVETADSLSGYFESDVWNRVVLQACYREAWARHAVIAIGALHMTLEAAKSRLGTTEPFGSEENHYLFALRQYSKALRLMQSFKDQPKDIRARNTLISSLLITCFESYIGNPKEAMRQCQTAVDIIFELEESGICISGEDISGLSSTSSFFDGDLIGSILSLDETSLMFQGTLSDCKLNYKRTKTLVFPKIPPSFTDVKEARLYWNVLQHRSTEWRSAKYQTFCPKRGSVTACFWDRIQKDRPPTRIRQELDMYAAALEQWFKAFQPIFDRSRLLPQTSKDFLAASVLKVKYLQAYAFTAMPAPSREEITGPIIPVYQEIVNLARCLLTTHDDKCKPGQAKFVFDDNLVTKLFLVALQCREDASLRWQVVSLLREYPRREGLWDSAMATTIATWIINQEEAFRVDGYIPKAARLRLVNTEGILRERKALVQCSKTVDGSEERVVLPEVILTW